MTKRVALVKMKMLGSFEDLINEKLKELEANEAVILDIKVSGSTTEGALALIVYEPRY